MRKRPHIVIDMRALPAAGGAAPRPLVGMAQVDLSEQRMGGHPTRSILSFIYTDLKLNDLQSMRKADVQTHHEMFHAGSACSMSALTLVRDSHG